MEIQSLYDQPAFQTIKKIPETPSAPQVTNAPLQDSKIATPDSLAPLAMEISKGHFFNVKA